MTELLLLLLLLLLLPFFSALFSLDRSCLDEWCDDDDDDEWWCDEWCLDDELFDLLDDDELCFSSLSFSFSLFLSLSFFELLLVDEWLPNVALDVPVIITSEFDELDDVGDDEWCDLLGEPIELVLNFFTLQLLQHHVDSCPFAMSESLIWGLWHSWWYNEVHLMHSIKRFFALTSIWPQITHDKSSNRMSWICVSIALSSTAAIESLLDESGNEMINGISCVWPLESVVMTVVVDVVLVVAIICTGLEQLESLDLLDERLTAALITPLPVALLSSAIYFLLNVFINILFGPCFCFITSSRALRMFSAASVFGECKHFKAWRNTGSNSTLATILISIILSNDFIFTFNSQNFRKMFRTTNKMAKALFRQANMNSFFSFSLLLQNAGNPVHQRLGRSFHPSSCTFVKRLKSSTQHSVRLGWIEINSLCFSVGSANVSHTAA